MRHTPRNIIRHELIGLKVEVVESANEFLVGISGLVLDETRNMLLIGEPGKRKRWVPKRGTLFRIWLPDGLRVLVEGDVIVGRPEDRLKKKLYKW